MSGPPLLLLPLLPLGGWLLLALMGRLLGRRGVRLVALASVGLCGLLVLAFGADLLGTPPAGRFLRQPLWEWAAVDGLSIGFALRLDPLSLTLAFVVSFVGFWIQLYATAYMAEEEGYARFFAYMCLFVGMMLTLVLADDLLLLYVGWEGVGLCSYLLIGFWYRDAANGEAARKAFVITRLGDTALLLGLLLIATELGTLQIDALLARAAAEWAPGSGVAVLASVLLLGGALGKSAQLPLHTWLPDAMAGPTPVSALIHAATMVTAGVYLIARLHPLYDLAPQVRNAIAIIGAATLLLAAASALLQRDIKRVLAYSTMSQIGYMFLALGVGAWSAAIFHLFTHAFFKALLFLAAGVVILALDHERSIDRMGGLRRRLPVAFWGFVVGGGALASLPLISAGFYSKEAILAQTYALPGGGGALWSAGLLGALLTAAYVTRLVLAVFFGEERTAVEHRPAGAMRVPLLVLMFFSVVAGWFDLPAALGGEAVHDAPSWLAPVTVIASIAGLLLAWRGWLPRRVTGYRAWNFDRLYGALAVRPFMRIAHGSGSEHVDRAFDAVAALHRSIYRLLARTQTGRIRWYAGGIAAGSVVALALVVVPWRF